VFQSGFWVVNVESGPFQKHVIANFYCWGLSWIICILLEGSTENANLFALQVLVELSVNSQEEVLLSELIHQNDLIPVIRDFGKALKLGQVNQGQNVFFETAAAEPDRAVQELVANSGIRSDALLDFLDVRTVFLAHNGNAVD
jgi:hypothetical protein